MDVFIIEIMNFASCKLARSSHYRLFMERLFNMLAKGSRRLQKREYHSYKLLVVFLLKVAFNTECLISKKVHHIYYLDDVKTKTLHLFICWKEGWNFSDKASLLT